MTGPHAADAEGRQDPTGQLAALCGPQTLFSQGLGENVFVQRQVRDHALQAGILVLERSQLPQRADAQVRVFLLPDVERRVAGPELSADVGGRTVRLTEKLTASTDRIGTTWKLAANRRKIGKSPNRNPTLSAILLAIYACLRYLVRSLTQFEFSDERRAFPLVLRTGPTSLLRNFTVNVALHQGNRL